MPRVITIPRLPPLREDVYIAKAQLQQAKRAQTVLDEAQQWAKQHIKQADEQIEAIHVKAFQHGYRDGIIAALQALANFLKEGQTLNQRLNKKLEEYAKTLLTNSLDHPDIALLLLSDWINAQKPTHNTALILMLPLNSKVPRDMILERLQLPWKRRIHIKYHQKDCFIIKYGDVIAEFDFNTFRNQSQQALMQKMSDVSSECYQLDQAAVKQIKHAFEQYFVSQEELTKGVQSSDDAAHS